jgi:hypothetical protein
MQPTVKAIILFLLVLPISSTVAAAPKADLWERWTAHDPGSRIEVDHSLWDLFLKRHIVRGEDGIHRIAYGSVTAEARQQLTRYLDLLQLAPVSQYSRPVQLAYWINLYNALTVRVVLEHYPVKSIRDIDISPGLFANGPWDKQLVEVEGVAVSLNDIEHRILRPIWQDARIHYAVNCASLGCPNLLATAFTPANSEGLLEQAARGYVNHPRGARIEKRKLMVSSIYHWFKADFGGNDAGVIAHLQQYADSALKLDLDGVRSIAKHGYDWALNDAP